VRTTRNSWGVAPRFCAAKVISPCGADGESGVSVKSSSETLTVVAGVSVVAGADDEPSSSSSSAPQAATRPTASTSRRPNKA